MLDKKIKKRMEEIEEKKGGLFIASFVFWELLELIPLKYQKETLKIAEHARENY